MRNNYCVIMGGGIGSRFWPLSRKDKPKQFLDFFGTGRSLLQTTFDRFSKIIPTENIFVVTNEAYSDLVREQLPEISHSQVLLEPIRRNTAPCIAYAAYHIQSINKNANIIVAPSDHLILKSDDFLKDVELGLKFVNKYPVLLTLGIKPSRPETGYGYIQVDGHEKEGVKKVKTFTEKPNIELAKVFLESGEFLWNSGIFMWNINTIIDAFGKHLPEIKTKFDEGISYYNTPKEKEFINKSFPFCPNVSIDYGILEKADNVFVKESEFGWSDLGTWGSLHELSDKDESNNVSMNKNVMYVDSDNNIVSVSEEKVVVLQGLDDYIVSESDNVLLICKKSEEQRIKHFVTDVKFRFGEDFI